MVINLKWYYKKRFKKHRDLETKRLMLMIIIRLLVILSIFVYFWPLSLLMIVYWIIFKPNLLISENEELDNNLYNLDDEELKIKKTEAQTNIKLSRYIPIFFGLVFIYYTINYIEKPLVNSNVIQVDPYLIMIVFILPLFMSIISTLIYSRNTFRTYKNSLKNSFISVGILVCLGFSGLIIYDMTFNYNKLGSIGNALEILLSSSPFIIVAFILTLIGSSIVYLISNIGYSIKSSIIEDYKK